MKYQSDLIKEIVEKRGHHLSSPHYESECVESWIEETKGAYPKLCDYESEWLNYINENPLGVFPYETLVDITKATVDNVVPYAYKSAILKGNTLVNISPLNDEITLAPGSVQFIDIPTLKSNTIYTISFNCSCLPSTNFMEFRQTFTNNALKIDNISIVQGYNRFKVKTVNKELNRFRIKNDSTSETDLIFNNLMILEGDYTNVDIPYFEGMQSVKMPVLKTTGKNLLDIKKFHTRMTATITDVQDNSITFDTKEVWAGLIQDFTLKPNTQYTLSCNTSTNIVNPYVRHVLADSSLTQAYGGENTFSFTTKETGKISITFENGDMENPIKTGLTVSNIQLEEGSIASTYEPFKTNILTVNEDVELRSNGNVYDELDLLTGKLTQRIGEDGVVLSQEVVKTVDLAVVNQDGDSLSKLIPIEGTMHLSTSSNTINPLFSGEIPVEAITQNLASFIEE